MKLIVTGILVFTILLCGCNSNKSLMIRNNNDLFDSLLLYVEINGKKVFDKYIPLSLTSPDYITKSIGYYQDSLFIDVSLPEIGIKKREYAASKDFKFIYIALTKEPNMQKIDSGLNKSQVYDKRQYFKSNVSISFAKRAISPVL